MFASQFTTLQPASGPSIKVACITPNAYQESGDVSSLLHDTSIAAARGARLAIWSESAVVLPTNKARDQLYADAAKAAAQHGIYIALAFDTSSSPRTNSMAIIGPSSSQPVLSYTKQHLLPIVESFSLTSDDTPVPTVELDLVLSQQPSRRQRKTRAVRLAPAICQDSRSDALSSSIY